jgi:hypothetical protein
MKTFFVSLFLIITIFCTIADPNILDLSIGLESGALPKLDWVFYETPFTSSNNFYVEMDVEFIIYDLWFIGGSMRNVFSFTGHGIVCEPTNMWFGACTGVRFYGFEVGIRHACYHPVMVYSTVYEQENRQVNTEGAYTEIYVRWEGKLKLF